MRARMRQGGPEIAFVPCLPSHWDHAELTLRRDGRTLRVLMCRPQAADALERARRAGAIDQRAGEAWRWDADDAPACVLLRLDEPSAEDDSDAESASRPRPTAAGAALRWAEDEAVPKVHPSTTP